MKNGIPKVSILVPIYNVEKYLDECLTSIVNQTLKDIEIICINDGSTDSSLDIIKKYMRDDKRIKLIDKPNSGYGDSMNQGLNIASGEYIGIVESDDIAKRKMFKTLYALAKKNDFPDIVKSNYFLFFGKTNDIEFKETLPKELLCNHNFNPLKKQKIFEYYVNNHAAIWSAIYKKDFLKKYSINFLPTKGASYQDISFNFKVLYFATSVYCTHKAFLKYRQDIMNSSNSKEKVFCINDEYEEIGKTVNNNSKIKSIFLVSKFNAYLWNYNRIDTQYKDIFLEKFREEFLKDKDYIKPKPFKKRRYYTLLMKLLKGIEDFKDEENRRKIKHLKVTTKKLFLKIKPYKDKSLILYGFNDIAKDILEKKNYKISFILDRNPQQEKFNGIPIYNINSIGQAYNNEIFIITALNTKFIEEIKKTILGKFPEAKIVSL